MDDCDLEVIKNRVDEDWAWFRKEFHMWDKNNMSSFCDVITCMEKPRYYDQLPGLLGPDWGGVEGVGGAKEYVTVLKEILWEGRQFSDIAKGIGVKLCYL